MANPNDNKQTPFSGWSREDMIAFVQEMRKPVKSEKEVREEDQAIADRKQMGETLEAGRKLKLQEQKDCAHMRRDGSTTVVWTGWPIEKLYCQVCSAWIGPNQPELFNRLYQLAL